MRQQSGHLMELTRGRIQEYLAELITEGKEANTAATRWLRAGGSEQRLMTVAGWSTRTMLDRYTGASAAERAAAEARGLNLGEA